MDLQSLLEADNLFGWPIEAVDELVALKQLANTDAITLADWRKRDQEVRAGLPQLSEDVKKVRDEVLDEVLGERYDDEAAKLLFQRLTAITHPAPDNTRLREDLVELTRMLKTDPKHHLAIQQRRERIMRWLRESDDERDSRTMLPWPLIARFRTVEDPQLGPVPQSVNAARRRALEHATKEQLAEAQAMGGGRIDGATAALSDYRESWFIRFPKAILSVDQGDAEAAELTRTMHAIWNNPIGQQVLRRETAEGWPPEYE